MEKNKTKRRCHSIFAHMMPTNNFGSIEEFVKGTVLLIDKPLGWTSFDVLNKVKGFVKHKVKIPPNDQGHQQRFKIGHAGTLDPLATGLLVICTGAFTKTIDSLQAGKKEYTGCITFGKVTPSFDLETPVEGEYPTDHINRAVIEASALSMTGEQMQRPPSYSAKQIDGQRAYKAARRGETVEIPEVRITIEDFKIIDFQMPDAHFHITCSKGTYIRTIANDVGKNLGSGSHLSALRRVASHPFHIENAITVEQLLDKLAQMTQV
jgi:tRNA pseudouridine55 synthase